MINQNNSSIYLFVGSINPVKMNSVKRATVTHWPNGYVIGYEVESGVSDQPLTDSETKQGAANRARAALKVGLQEWQSQHPEQNPHQITALGIGLEGGVFEEDGEMWSTVWVAVIDQNDIVYSSNGARFPVPKVVADRIRQGEEMGIAAQHISGIENVKHKNGLIGIITDNFIDRTTEYSSITRLAIGLWYGRDWEKQLQPK